MIRKSTQDNKYLTIKNGAGKTWILDRSDLETAFQIYEPSSNKGKLIKKYLPVIARIPGLRELAYSALKINYRDYVLPIEVEKSISNIFGGKERHMFSVFCGTANVHQKTTIQIFRKKEIIGYCKCSVSEEVKGLFRHEKTILDFLQENGIKCIPKCLLCTEFPEGLGVFIQSTKKTNKSYTNNVWNNELSGFLKILQEHTSQNCRYCDTEYKQMLDSLVQNVNLLLEFGVEKIACLLNAIKIAEDYLENINCYSVCHRDFTPWNIFYEGSELFVFDFEYARKTYPAYIDIFHFFTQSAIYEKSFKPNEVFLEIQKNEVFHQFFDSIEIGYVLYLIDYIALYTEREKGHFNDEISRDIDYRLSLLSKCMEVLKAN